MKDMEKKITDIIKGNRPQFNQRVEVRNKIMAQIDDLQQNNNKSSKISFYWTRLAAITLLLIGLGNLAMQEWNTQCSILEMKTVMMKTSFKNTSGQYCQESLSIFLKRMNKPSIRAVNPTYSYLMSLADIAYLEQVRSPYLTDVKEFLKVLERYYPNIYIAFMQHGEVELPIYDLTKDERICELFSH